MSEPLLPHPSTDSDGETDESRVGVPDEPDVPDAPAEPDSGIDVTDRPDPVFRTPTPGASSSAEDLENQSS